MPAILTYPAGSNGLPASDIGIRVKRAFGDEAGVQIDDADIYRWINDGQLDIVRKTECIQRVSELNSVAGVTGYPVPYDFLFFKRASYNGRLLSSIAFQTLDQMYPNREYEAPTGLPEYVTVFGANFVLYPAPAATASGNLDVTYVARPAQVALATDIPEIPVAFHEALFLFAMMRAKELDQDWQASQLFHKQYDDMVIGARHDTQTQNSDAYPVVQDYDGDY